MVDEAGRFTESVVSSWIANHPGLVSAVVLGDVVVGAVKVPVDPDVGEMEQVVVGVTEACRAGPQAVPRIC